MPSQFTEGLLSAEFPEIIGQDRVKRQLKSALLSGRHVILVGPPGVGKTTLAKSVSRLLPDMELTDDAFRREPDGKAKTRTFSGEERFVRVQGSPDLTAEDLIGDIDPVRAMEYGPLSVEAFTPGKIFKANNGVLFFDEINRCSDKLQNAMLQVLQERVATVGSYDVDFPASFVFIGTMNPDDNSTEELSKVFLDRFDLIYMSYPDTLEDEVRIVKEYARLHAPVPDALTTYAVRFVRGLRLDKNLEMAPSVRATLGLIERASANATLSGHDAATLQDLSEAVASVLAHRLSLKPAARYLKTAQQYVAEEFSAYTEENRLQLGEGG